jgi:hypothetical protein
MALQYEQAGGDLQTSKALEMQKQRVQRLVEKAGLMQKMCQKQCYSKRIFFKRHIMNQQKLNAFLGRGIVADWASSHDGSQAESEIDNLTIQTEAVKEGREEEIISYSVLLQHIEAAEKNYEGLRK